jgi:hypothetical protein
LVHYGVYARLAKLEIAAGEKPKVRDVALPEDTEQRARQWAKGEAEREKQREAFLGRLQAVGKDPMAELLRSVAIPSWASRMEPDEEQHAHAQHHVEQRGKPRAAGEAHGADALLECFALEVGGGCLLQ